MEKLLDALMQLAPILIIGIYFGKIEMRINNLEKNKGVCDECRKSKC